MSNANLRSKQLHFYRECKIYLRTKMEYNQLYAKKNCNH